MLSHWLSCADSKLPVSNFYQPRLCAAAHNHSCRASCRAEELENSRVLRKKRYSCYEQVSIPESTSRRRQADAIRRFWLVPSVTEVAAENFYRSEHENQDALIAIPAVAGSLQSSRDRCIFVCDTRSQRPRIPPAQFFDRRTT